MKADAIKPTRASGDLVTKERLLEVATRLFAEHGFSKVTVRDICAPAKANVAAINYHFGGKVGLYEEVLRSAIRIMQTMTEDVRRAGDGLPAEKQLAVYVRTFLERVTQNRNGWIHQLMMHEMQDPTPALDLVVKDVLKPRLAYLRTVVAAILGCDTADPRVERCVGSVQAQCLSVMWNPIGRKLGIRTIDAAEVPELAAHISAFSVAGIRALR
jgi:TetR/AcrR family transcriptional regulator, regulator of cefoperazone and chloramphenicol sensitivity